MATNIAASTTVPATAYAGDGGSDGSDDEAAAALRQEVVVSTCVVVLGLSTACLGLLLVIVGRARLAKFVAYLPMPVISGYLGFIGLFCIEAGLSLCTGLVIQGLSDWPQLLAAKAALLSVPGLAAGLVLCLVSRYAEHEAVLPAVMIALPLLFWRALLLLGLFSGGEVPLDSARAFGWLGEDTAGGSVGDMVALFDFGLVDWTVLPQQLPVFASMVFVVAFSSCLDVAAIEMDVGRPLDVNSELTVVGYSNVVSGLLGGFTGSYIFSQTIFTCRSRCHSRKVGAVVAAAELAVVALKVNLLAFVPLFFFAATLMFIGFDLMSEWLVDVRHKLDPMEYGVVLLTFAAIEVLGLNEGLVVGVLGSALQFLVLYANQPVVSQVDRQSMVIRTPAASAMIHRQYKQGTIATLELRGSLFFMSPLKILEEVRGVLRGQHRHQLVGGGAQDGHNGNGNGSGNGNGNGNGNGGGAGGGGGGSAVQGSEGAATGSTDCARYSSERSRHRRSHTAAAAAAAAAATAAAEFTTAAAPAATTTGSSSDNERSTAKRRSDGGARSATRRKAGGRSAVEGAALGDVTGPRKQRDEQHRSLPSEDAPVEPRVSQFPASAPAPTTTRGREASHGS